MDRRRLVFPFSAIVGLEKLKLAILINAINPKIGGVLIRGPKGSGKTSIVRSLADILPKIRVVKDCPFNCSSDDPSNMCPICSEKYRESQSRQVEEKDMTIVELPLGATEDRLIGSLNIEKAIKQGILALEPGILAAANQNVLYVDEVNLLPDHIADDLLDAAATGWNVVEREGISVSHPSRFIFIGTMNPEEGELRPQLLDRFPLSINLESINSIEDRVEVIKRNMEFEAEPETFVERYKPTQEEIRNRILQAREILPKVILSEEALRSISKACLDLEVDGLRPDIVIAKSASTLAAFENRTEVTVDDILVAAELALSHRTRQGGFVEAATPQEIADAFMASAKNVFKFEKTGEKSKEEMQKSSMKGKGLFWVKKDASIEEEKKAEKKGIFEKIQQAKLKLNFLLGRFTGGVWGIGKKLKRSPDDAPMTDSMQVGGDKLRGETNEEQADSKKGEKKGYPTVSGELSKIIGVTQGYPLLNTIGARVKSPSKFLLEMTKTKPAKKRNALTGRRPQLVMTLGRGRPYGWETPHGRPADIHLSATIREAARWQKDRERPSGTALSIFFEDIRENLRSGRASLTMVFVIDLSGSMLYNVEAVKEALLRLHSDAYRGRDRVGIVALKGLDAEVVQHPITNLRVVANKLVKMRISGFTPLAAGMQKGLEVLKEARQRDPSTMPVMVIVTDGSANIPLKRGIETGQVRKIDESLAAVREYEDLAVKDAFSMSKIIRREGIHLIAVNTNPHIWGRESYGFSVTEQIARLTGGTHHAIGTLRTEKEMIDSMIEQMREDERSILANRAAG